MTAAPTRSEKALGNSWGLSGYVGRKPAELVAFTGAGANVGGLLFAVLPWEESNTHLFDDSCCDACVWMTAAHFAFA
jgi:hypothetical protein